MARHHYLVTPTLALGGLAPAASAQRPRATPVQVVQIPARDSVDWGDMAISAAGGLGLSMLAVGGSLVINRKGGKAP